VRARVHVAILGGFLVLACNWLACACMIRSFHWSAFAICLQQPTCVHVPYSFPNVFVFFRLSLLACAESHAVVANFYAVSCFKIGFFFVARVPL
jgi:hypothetical protein